MQAVSSRSDFEEVCQAYETESNVLETVGGLGLVQCSRGSEDPNDPNKAWNVGLKCKICDAFLSSSNPSRIASTHLMKGGCPKIKGDADIATEKLVFVSSAAKVKQKDLRSMEEKELELLCTSVNEESF
ncbi:TPA: hypothetical protein ACH3X1_016019 [Trebouxia sp. C0004]